MNRADLREMAASLRSMTVNPNDTVKVALLNKQIDLACRKLASEQPEAFMPDVERVILLPDYSGTGPPPGITVKTTADSYVLEFVGSSSTFTPDTTGVWNGIYHIEVTDPTTSVIHRHQCREFWLDVGTGNYRVSLDRPVNFTGQGLSWRLHQPEFFTTADVIRILEGSLFIDAPASVVPLPRSSFLVNRRTDYRGGQNSQPVQFWRKRHFQMDAPTKAPLVAVTTPQPPALAQWVVEPIGTFEYCFTYCWGNKNPEIIDPFGRPEPLWESAPSPISTAAVVTDTTSTVTLTLPEISWMVNFQITGTLRAGHSGIYKRLYRRRSVTGASPVAHATIEAPNVFQHLGDVDDAATTYVDVGAVIPDYYRRLPESQGYYSWVPWPHQDKQYDLDLYVERAPRLLANDNDAPRVQASHLPMLVELCAYYFAKLDNDAPGAQDHLVTYMNLAKDFTRQQANSARSTPGVPWGGYSPRLRFLPVTTD